MNFSLPPIDSTVLLAELRTLSRGSLLVIAERAAELIPADQLSELLGDFVTLEATARESYLSSPTLLDDARKFYDAAMAGHYYKIVEINNRGSQEQSASTDAFVAECNRLMRRCTHAARNGEFAAARDSIELLLNVLRRVDEGTDDVLFFADDGGLLNVGVNWRSALPVYFQCLAATLSPAEFARTVVSTIDEFVSYDRPHYLAAAHVVANDDQRAVLGTLVTHRV